MDCILTMSLHFSHTSPSGPLVGISSGLGSGHGTLLRRRQRVRLLDYRDKKQKIRTPINDIEINTIKRIRAPEFVNDVCLKVYS